MEIDIRAFKEVSLFRLFIQNYLFKMSLSIIFLLISISIFVSFLFESVEKSKT